MKTTLPILSLLFVTTAFAAGRISAPVATPVSDNVLLSAIATVETGNNSAHLGRYGERTRLQILPETWREFSRLPHSAAASNRAETDRVARAYLAVIRQRLNERGLPETPFYIAACWNAGPGWKRLHPATVSYAERVSNLVEAAMAEKALAARNARAAQEALAAEEATAKARAAAQAALAKALVFTPTAPVPASSVLTAPPARVPSPAAQVVVAEAKPVPVIDLSGSSSQPRASLVALQIGAGAFFHID